MKLWELSRYGLTSCVALALLAGCGGSQSSTGFSDLPSSPPATARASQVAARDDTGGTLLYVGHGNQISVLTYPGGKMVGQLTGFKGLEGLCSDPQGNVFAVDGTAETISEYAHGGTSPIAVLNDTGNAPNGCAIDPTTGNLAVAGGGGHIQTNVAVYPSASGSPTVYVDYTAFEPYYYCTYDNAGNIFMASQSTGPGYLIELPSASISFKYYSLSRTFTATRHSVAWDGSDFAVGNPPGYQKGSMKIYRVQLTSSGASVVRTITLKDKKGQTAAIGSQLWIDGSTVIYPEASQSKAGFWRYPLGNMDTKTVRVGDGDIYGIAVSSSETP